MVEAAMAAPPILVLGGTGEARTLVDRLAQAGHRDVRLSLSGATQTPALPAAGLVRTGGFGGAQGLADYLKRERIALLIDASHPYAAQITAHAHTAAQQAGLPLLRFSRLPWTACTGDRWITAADHRQAADMLARFGARCFLSIGRKEVAAYADCRDQWFLIRSIEPPDPGAAPARHRWISARGPFDMAAEAALMREERIDCLVTKNSGGDATYGKIAAARLLGLPVVMIDRPPTPQDCTTTESIDDTLGWVTQQLSGSV